MSAPSAKLIRFSESPRAIVLAAPPAAGALSHDELEAARREGYHRGAEETSRSLERQLIHQREELVQLQSETFAALTRQQAAMFEQLREAMPGLVMEAVARILGGFQPDAETVRRIVDDVLGELAPTGEAVEVTLHPHDLEMIAGYEPNLREKFPTLAFKPGPDLQRGDAVVRSRFGVVDGRLGTKFRAVEAMFQ